MPDLFTPYWLILGYVNFSLIKNQSTGNNKQKNLKENKSHAVPKKSSDP